MCGVKQQECCRTRGAAVIQRDYLVAIGCCQNSSYGTSKADRHTRNSRPTKNGTPDSRKEAADNDGG
eukprot:IDg13104t1